MMSHLSVGYSVGLSVGLAVGLNVGLRVGRGVSGIRHFFPPAPMRHSNSKQQSLLS